MRIRVSVDPRFLTITRTFEGDVMFLVSDHGAGELEVMRHHLGEWRTVALFALGVWTALEVEYDDDDDEEVSDEGDCAVGDCVLDRR